MNKFFLSNLGAQVKLKLLAEKEQEILFYAGVYKIRVAL
jgi:hypothetical protein